MNFKDEKVKLCSLLHLFIKRSQKGFFFNPVNCFFIAYSYSNLTVFLLLLCFSF